MLAFLSPVYAAAVAARGRLYDGGWLAVARLDVPVISVGNLTAGGSGKSPMVELIARILAQRGHAPAVVSRGYGGSHSGRATVVSDGRGPLVDAGVAGDEPVMLATALTGVPVIVSRRRRNGGELAVARYRSRCVVLDDAFQHRALARDLDLLLLDGAEPFGNGRLLPAGPLREPVSAMARAGAIVITRADRAGSSSRDAIARAAERHCPAAPIFEARTEPAALIDLASGEALPVSRLAGARVVCFAGIARPDRFFEDAARAGAEVAAAFPFPDHHRFGAADLDAIAAAASRLGADLILTTQKDAARLDGPAAAGRLPRLHALRVATTIDEHDSFASLVESAAS
ncbi:MAG TPA: tetraacyldisaccharide 4'-kinase [Candidatus Polarisedimenticolia bacterium]